MLMIFTSYQTKKVLLEDTEMDYITFGQGDKPLIMIPGLSDGLKTVKGQGLLLSYYYRKFAKEFTVYIFSRKNKISEGYSTRDMAKDQKKVMDLLGIKKAYVMGISQGGMIAQYLAIDYPEIVERLVIGVSASRHNSTIEKVVGNWIQLANSNEYGRLIIDTMEKTYSDKGIKKYQPFYPIIRRIGKPKSFHRFILQAMACLSHNAYDELDKIQCKTLVIGGDVDKVVGENTSEEMAEKIKDSKLVLYKGLGHGAYEEDANFNRQVMDFLLK